MKEANLLFSHIAFFQNVRKLFKSNKTHRYSSSWHVNSKSKRVSDLACLEKKFVSRCFCTKYANLLFSYIAFFQNVRKLFKSNETHSYSSSWHVDSKSKRISDLACIEKKFVSRCFRTK